MSYGIIPLSNVLLYNPSVRDHQNWMGIPAEQICHFGAVQSEAAGIGAVYRTVLTKL